MIRDILTIMRWDVQYTLGVVYRFVRSRTVMDRRRHIRRSNLNDRRSFCPACFDRRITGRRSLAK